MHIYNTMKYYCNQDWCPLRCCIWKTGC